jgi:tripartite-type tricarboxylate transporter receptor subunit TctC
MRRLLLVSALAAASLQIGPQAAAQNWPTRPVTLVVPFAPGGTDVLSGYRRRLSEVFRPAWWSRTSAAPAA